MDLGLKSRRAVVGGASSGLGLAIAAQLAAEGCRLLLWARHADRLDKAADDLRARYEADVATTVADAEDPLAAHLVAERAREALGGVDILVLNAGGPSPVDPAQTQPEQWRA